MKNKNIGIVVVPTSSKRGGRSNERGHQFEELVRILLETLAFRVKSRVFSSGTELDLTLENIVTGDTAIAQCKDQKLPIGTRILQQLHSQAVTSGDPVALLFTTSILGPSAQEYLDKSILTKFPKFRVYEAHDIVDLLVASRNVHRPEVLDAFVESQGCVAYEWHLCVYNSRLYWASELFRPGDIRRSSSLNLALRSEKRGCILFSPDAQPSFDPITACRNS